MNLPLSHIGARTEDPPISWLLKVAIDKPDLISLAAGFTDEETLPVIETIKLVSSILNGKNARKALQYGATEGDKLLRKLTVERLKKLDNTENSRYSDEGVIITNGSQQFLYLLAEALCDPGDIVIVEAPTYFVFLGIIQSLGIAAKNVRMERDGINLDSLKNLLESLNKSGALNKVKFLYSVTYFQNPTSRTTSADKKEEILKILKSYEKKAGYPIFYVEDAAYRELRFFGNDVPSSLALSKNNSNVIYTSTYSKPFATGIRVGFGVLPEKLGKVIKRIKGNHDFGTSNFLQFIISEALSSKLYDKHLQVIVDQYRQKAEVMDREIKKHFKFPHFYEKPAGGLYFWVSLEGNKNIRTDFNSKIFKKCLENNVIYVPGDVCYANDPEFGIPRHEMRISFGYASEIEIVEGIKRLGLSIQTE